MGKLRIYELAKQLKITSKELLELLTEMGIDAKSHMSTLDHSTIKQILNSLGESELLPATDAGADQPVEKPTKKDADRRRK